MPPEESGFEPALERAREGWDRVYREGRPPWDIDRPQPAFVRLADAGEITGPALDCGCGTGEQALMLAQRGIEVLGIDLAPAAVDAARRKAAERAIAATFAVANALDLGALGRRFATVVDSGVFHVFNDRDRGRYVASLATALLPGGVLHLACFSELTPGTDGPRRVTQTELRSAFGAGWVVERIEAVRYEVRGTWGYEPPHAWLARISRD